MISSLNCFAQLFHLETQSHKVLAVHKPLPKLNLCFSLIMKLIPFCFGIISRKFRLLFSSSPA